MRLYRDMITPIEGTMYRQWSSFFSLAAHTFSESAASRIASANDGSPGFKIMSSTDFWVFEIFLKSNPVMLCHAIPYISRDYISLLSFCQYIPFGINPIYIFSEWDFLRQSMYSLWTLFKITSLHHLDVSTRWKYFQSISWWNKEGYGRLLMRYIVRYPQEYIQYR